MLKKTPKNIWIRAKGKHAEATGALEQLQSSFEREGFRADLDLRPDTDLCVCLGGDGSLLSGIRDLGDLKRKVPVLGVHTSRGLGFLHPLSLPTAEAQIPEFVRQLSECLKSGEFQLEERWGLEASLLQEKNHYWALNDIVVGKGVLSRMVHLQLRVDGTVVLEKMRGDGLIVSSATGSTAYALSAGGPVIHPSLSVLLVTPICPHQLGQRPLLLGSDVKLEIEVLDHTAPCFLTADGQAGQELKSGAVLEIYRSAQSVHLLRPDSKALAAKNYYEILRSKLGYGRG